MGRVFVHVGQFGQPSPDPVKRTVEPVKTINHCINSEAEVASFTVFSEYFRLVSTGESSRICVVMSSVVSTQSRAGCEAKKGCSMMPEVNQLHFQRQLAYQIRCLLVAKRLGRR